MPDQPWYRAWRHEELAREKRLAADERYRRRERAKRIVGDALLVGAIVAFAWASMPL